MAPFRAATGVVDRLNGLPLPKSITLSAILLRKKLNLDGLGFEPEDVVSYCPVPIEFQMERDELRNTSPVCLFLTEGSWSELYIRLHDADGEPVAKGAVAFRGPASQWIETSPDMISITTRRPA